MTVFRLYICPSSARSRVKPGEPERPLRASKAFNTRSSSALSDCDTGVGQERNCGKLRHLSLSRPRQNVRQRIWPKLSRPVRVQLESPHGKDYFPLFAYRPYTTIEKGHTPKDRQAAGHSPVKIILINKAGDQHHERMLSICHERIRVRTSNLEHDASPHAARCACPDIHHGLHRCSPSS